MWLVAAVTLQAALGILTLLNQVPIALALAHQAVAIAVLTLAVFQTERLAADVREKSGEVSSRERIAPGWLARAHGLTRCAYPHPSNSRRRRRHRAGGIPIARRRRPP